MSDARALLRRFVSHRINPCGAGFAGALKTTPSIGKNVRSICRDPIRPAAYYVGTSARIHRIVRGGGGGGGGGGGNGTDGSDDVVIAGGAPGMRNGTCEESQFFNLGSICPTADGRELFMVDHSNQRVRSVNLISDSVSTFTHFDCAGEMVWDRSPPSNRRVKSGPPDLFLASGDEIVRLSTVPDSMATVKRYGLGVSHELSGLACTETGLLLFISNTLNGVFCFDPVTETSERLAGQAEKERIDHSDGSDGSSSESESAAAEASDSADALTAVFSSPACLCIDDRNRCVYIGQTDRPAIRVLTLPPRCFMMPVCSCEDCARQILDTR